MSSRAREKKNNAGGVDGAQVEEKKKNGLPVIA